MSFEVLEPTWEDLIAKISVGKVSNVDQVLQIHSDFLSTCLNDCLLSNTQLLSTVKKLLGVCSEFSYYMNELVRTHHMFSRILKFLFVQSNLAIRNLLVTLKLFLNAKSSLLQTLKIFMSVWDDNFER